MGAQFSKHRKQKQKIGEQESTKLPSIHTAKKAVSRVRVPPQNNVQYSKILGAHTLPG